MYEKYSSFFKSHVAVLRRDFSTVLVPRSLYFKIAGKKLGGLQGKDINSCNDYFNHVNGCSCIGGSDDIDIIGDDSPIHYNDSVNGYLITGRSKQAIRNAANSIFFRVEDKTNLRFVTFTFPKLPKQFDSKTDEDKFLHSLFLKFLDNERKNYGLTAWLWVNERQSGERLKDGEKTAREVLHYHCLFVYKDYLNYSICNLRFLRLLQRNGFSVLSSFAGQTQKGTPEFDRVATAYRELKKGNYDFFLKNSENMYMRDLLGIKRFIFVSPVDFEKIKYSTLDIGRVSTYISKYCSKSSDKIFCRRWGSSRGLIVKKETLKEFCLDHFSEEIVDESTGEIIFSVDNPKLFNFLIMGDMKSTMLKFTQEIDGKETEMFYVPPNWGKWAKHSGIRSMFIKYFNYKI